MKVFGLLAILAAISSTSFAAVVAAPEIDGNSASSAVALIAGAVLVVRARRK